MIEPVAFESLDIYKTGPKKPLGSVVYFCVRGEETLSTPPFNTPVTVLSNTHTVYSITPPFHSPPYKKEQAIHHWCSAVEKGSSELLDFIDRCSRFIEHIAFLEKKRIALMGLSRGAFIACHVASRSKHVSSIVGFAPMLSLSVVHEASTIPDQLLAQHEIPKEPLLHIPIRFYIGNRDKRVDTMYVCQWITSLASLAHDKRIRASSFELIIGSSHGHLGHGTLEPTFLQGAEWLRQSFLS